MLQAGTTYDVAVLGGGASGLAAAIAAARAGARTVVLERDVACGLPILATGNGRCNLSNAHLDPLRYRWPEAARAVMGEAAEDEVARFFGSLGLMMCETDGRLYPRTRRAQSVRDVLLAACGWEGVELRCGCDLVGAARDASGEWMLRLSEPERAIRLDDDVRRARKALDAAARTERPVRARRVVLAVGGSSEAVCRLFGLEHVAEEPVLCPIACTCPLGPLASLDGLRVEGALTLKGRGARAYREAGEVLFRSYGISGIAAFDLSRRVHPGDAIEFDAFPDMDDAELLDRLRGRERALGPFAGRAPWFDGVLARPLAELVCGGACGLEAAALRMKHLEFAVTGLTGRQQAQVRRGGIPLHEVDLATMSVAPGLHACGEALDQDADCGGYNLAWAWLSGLRAGAAAALPQHP